MENNKEQSTLHKPWHGYETRNQEDDLKLSRATTADEYVFYVFTGEDSDTFVVITPYEYFKEENCQWDQSLMIDHLLPDDIHEEMEGVYFSSKSKSETRKELLKRGFKEDSSFNVFAQEHIEDYFEF